jgi:hypothetical protein
MRSIVIPNKVVSIGRMAFNLCSSLTGIIIPESVKFIGCPTIQACSSLSSVSLLGESDWNLFQVAGFCATIKISAADLANGATCVTYLQTTYSKFWWVRA